MGRLALSRSRRRCLPGRRRLLSGRRLLGRTSRRCAAGRGRVPAGAAGWSPVSTLATRRMSGGHSRTSGSGCPAGPRRIGLGRFGWPGAAGVPGGRGQRWLGHRWQIPGSAPAGPVPADGQRRRFGPAVLAAAWSRPPGGQQPAGGRHVSGLLAGGRVRARNRVRYAVPPGMPRPSVAGPPPRPEAARARLRRRTGPAPRPRSRRPGMLRPQPRAGASPGLVHLPLRPGCWRGSFHPGLPGSASRCASASAGRAWPQGRLASPGRGLSRRAGLHQFGLTRRGFDAAVPTGLA